MIQVKQVNTEKEMKQFVSFPFSLYKNNPYWVPSLLKGELKSFNLNDHVQKTVSVKYYLAYKNQEIVGRIAVIINWNEVNQLHKRKVRFGWFDFIDDINVSQALLQKAIEFAQENDLEYIEGPMGFNNMDKAGMLTKGFDYLPTMIGLYNYEYYPKHMEQLGYKPEAEWIEYQMTMENVGKVWNMEKFAPLIEKRYKVRALKFNNTKEILPYVDEMFAVLNHAYSDLQSYVPIEQYQIDHYKEKYIGYIHPDFISIIVNDQNKIIAFAITMPSFSKAFKKANGSLFPFGWYHLLKAMKKNDHAEFYLIGIEPEYQSKGIPALIFRDFYNNFKKRGIKTVETNPLLIENNKIQQLWQQFSPELHKERKTFRKNVK
ncbi:GTP cyclohydrolase [Flavobacterium agricola]|uniref:GTP cyclohydrolase n=1 Tax=Flavobacterium agricola TaxID=2870839 RepID=A0ABY6M1K3_9FLAO|nr:GTP cyclohydrolase [Flavobacterium agricola]UYW01108.1 GTP cyclohydrolase [Flavobacterium agricola]